MMTTTPIDIKNRVTIEYMYLGKPEDSAYFCVYTHVPEANPYYSQSYHTVNNNPLYSGPGLTYDNGEGKFGIDTYELWEMMNKKTACWDNMRAKTKAMCDGLNEMCICPDWIGHDVDLDNQPMLLLPKVYGLFDEKPMMTVSVEHALDEYVAKKVNAVGKARVDTMRVINRYSPEQFGHVLLAVQQFIHNNNYNSNNHDPCNCGFCATGGVHARMDILRASVQKRRRQSSLTTC